jgi:hypothetical protein
VNRISQRRRAAQQHPRADYASKRMERIFQPAIEDAIDDGDFRDDISPRLAAYAIFGMINWTHRWFTPGKRYSPRSSTWGWHSGTADALRSDIRIPYLNSRPGLLRDFRQASPRSSGDELQPGTGYVQYGDRGSAAAQYAGTRP